MNNQIDGNTRTSDVGLERRNDDEIINQPISKNSYKLIVSTCGLTMSSDTGNMIQFKISTDYLNAAFPLRKLIVRAKDKEIFAILNSKKDKNGMVDLQLMVEASPEATMVKNKPFEDGLFKAMIVDGDTNVSLYETIDPNSLSKNSDRIGMNNITFHLFKANEIAAFDNNNINFCSMGGMNLKHLLTFIFLKYTKSKFLISEPEHNPDIGRLLIPQCNLMDLIRLIDSDMGIYKTKPMLFVDKEVLYFLNTDNLPNCRNPKLEFSINIMVSKDGKSALGSTVDKLKNGNYTVTIGSGQSKISKEVAGRLSETVNFIYPNGKKETNMNAMGRNVRTVRKITNVKPLMKYNNRVREILNVEIQNVAFEEINPLSTIFYTDSLNKRRMYRVAGYEIDCKSRESTVMRIKGFRLLEEGD